LCCVLHQRPGGKQNGRDLSAGDAYFFGLTGCAAIFLLVKSSRKHRLVVYALQERQVLKVIAGKFGGVAGMTQCLCWQQKPPILKTDR
jgi:hypothetical protein